MQTVRTQSLDHKVGRDDTEPVAYNMYLKSIRITVFSTRRSTNVAWRSSLEVTNYLNLCSMCIDKIVICHVRLSMKTYLL